MLTEINNCIFYNNYTTGIVITAHPAHYLPGNIYYDSLILRNSIIWEPETTPANLFYSNNPQFLGYRGFNIDHCLIHLPASELATMPQFPDNLGDHNLYALDPLFEAPDTFNFHLQPCSPAINAGDNLAAQTAGLINDLAGQPRISDGTIDLGVFESGPLQLEAPPQLTTSCADQANGSAQLSVPNACLPLQYAWTSGAQSGSDLAALAPGNYQLTISDAKGKQLLLNFSIGQSPAPQIMTDIQSASGALAPDGAIQVTVLGGTAPYQYLWSNGDTTAAPAGLLPGMYQLQLSDAAGCSYMYTYTVPFSSAAVAPETPGAALWPNPARDRVHIRWGGATYWQLFSTDGRLLLHHAAGREAESEVSVGHLPEGVYYYQLSGNDPLPTNGTHAGGSIPGILIKY